MKYIDVDKLKAEIERRQKENRYDELPMTIDRYYKAGRYYEDRDILTFIDSLQQEQPGVDLENTIRIEFGTRAKVEDGRRCVKLNWDKFSVLAHHFYELGRNSK